MGFPPDHANRTGSLDVAFWVVIIVAVVFTVAGTIYMNNSAEPDGSKATNESGRPVPAVLPAGPHGR